MERLMARFSPECRPGVSTKISCSVGVVLIPNTRRRVVWGLGVTMLILRPTSALTSVDLPTLGRPRYRDEACTEIRISHVRSLQGATCSFLFGGTAAAGLAFGADMQQADAAADTEGLLMGLAAHRFYGIHRQGQFAGLQHFLQAGLGILESFGGERRSRRLSSMRRITSRAASKPASRNTAPTRASRASASIEARRITATLEFAGSEDEIAAEVQFPRHFRQGLLVHQAGTQAAEVALFQIGWRQIQGLGDAGIDQRVAQELQAFVVTSAGAAVGERQA